MFQKIKYEFSYFYFSGPEDLIFLYINAIVNGLQGVFVFIIYCIYSQETLTAAKTLLFSIFV